MDEYFRIIEEKMKAVGYEVDGSRVYNEICDEMDGKENGHYVLMAKQDGDVHFEYHIEIMDEEFNLEGIQIIDGDKKVYVNFDE